MTLEEMYSTQFDFGDEDDDSDWDPSDTTPKWFCRNCTMPNIQQPEGNQFCNVGIYVHF